MSHVLEINNLVKHYGSIKALNDISFKVPQGTVFGILGPNGSGKTTMLGIIMDILRPTSGSVNLFGKTPDADLRKKIGTLLETPNFYHYLSAVKNLEIAAAIKGVENPDIEGVLKKVNLYERRNSKFQTFSLGMKQRLAIASCLLGNPDVLIFDEPTNGLDPVGIAEIRNLIKQVASEGRTIIMASHLLDEVEKVCTHMVIMKRGTLLASGSVDEILSNEDIAEISATDNRQLVEVLRAYPGYSKLALENTGFVHITFPLGMANPEAINKYCFDKGIVLKHLQLKKKSLEARFLEMTS
jgi:ABC-2 type transport system ATP-binding protein